MKYTFFKYIYFHFIISFYKRKKLSFARWEHNSQNIQFYILEFLLKCLFISYTVYLTKVDNYIDTTNI